MQITVHATVANAAARLPHGKERAALERVVDMLDYRVTRSEVFGDAGATLIEVDEDASEQRIGHICPHCKSEPAQLAMHMANFGGVPAFIFSCSGCRKIISVSALPPMPMMQPQEQQSSLILPPRM